jgi:hypothetical protein
MTLHRLKVVGGTDVDCRDQDTHQPNSDDVYREARRRLAIANVSMLRIRALAAGRDVPKTAGYRVMQIEFVARSLASLRPIPADFADDIYWPA